jgi:GTP pyrophosphokinase
MQKKDLDYRNIYDYSAIRVLVPTIEDCYTALSIIHHLWEHVSNEFDDYIAHPKPNGYRSIHTAVIGPDEKHFEIQIRTFDMHEEAEHGIAAHWLYKEDKTHTQGYEAKIGILRQLFAWHKDLTKEDNATDSLPRELFEDRVYVFTPAGDIMDLPKGATPLDFAYHIHSELGHRCRGAKINGHIVPLTYALRTGDRVDIITTPHGTPSRDWLNKDSGYIVTARARAKIGQWFRQQEITQYIDTAKATLERELTRAGITHIDLKKIASLLQYKNEEALLSALGHGSIRPSQIIHASHLEKTEETHPTTHAIPLKKESLTSGFEVYGIDDLLTRIAKCCKPIPGDKVIGYITQGRGVSIHKQQCINVSDLSPEHGNRLIAVNWDHKHQGAFYVDLKIFAEKREELLHEITSIIANAKIMLMNLNSTINKKNNTLFISLTLQTRGTDEINHLIQQLEQLRGVNGVKRI